MSMEKPICEACKRNQQAILEQLQTQLCGYESILEIGSGTGQHAVFFAKAMPSLQWQTSDLAHKHDGIKAWLNEVNLVNVLPPLELDIANQHWPIKQFDIIYTANTLHIISWELIKKLFQHCSQHLVQHGRLIIYGPFNYHGKYTSTSNQAFDAMLKQANPHQGIRDFSDIEKIAELESFHCIADISMPANNRLLTFEYCGL